MELFEINITETQGIAVCSVKGFLNDLAGAELNDKVQALLKKGKINIVIDFTGCKVINSPGTSFISELVWIINDDFKGKVFFLGLDKLKKNVFATIGILPPAIEIENLQAAIDQIG